MSKSEIDTLDEFAEAENTLLMFVTYMIFGMVMLAPMLKHISPPMIIYALLSLTIVRMLPVAISLIGTKLQPITVLFMGWFGPQGDSLHLIYPCRTRNRGDRGERDYFRCCRDDYFHQRAGAWHQRRAFGGTVWCDHI